MTAPTGLGQYVKPQGSQGDRIQARQMVDRPILVWVRKLQHLNRTKYSNDGGDAIYIDFIDLLSNQVYIEVMWMAGAIVDGLKQYAGDGNAYPVKIVKVEGGQWGSYQTIESLSEDPQWMNHVLANLPAFQNLVAQTRAQKEAEWAVALQQANQPPAPPQMGGPPPAPALAPAGAAAPPFQQPGQQAQYGAPAQQFQQPAAAVAPPPPPPQQQVPAGPPPQYQQQAPPAQPQYTPQQQPAAPPSQPGYPPQQYAQPVQQPQAAVAPPQYQQAPAAPPQQFQQAGPPAVPVQQYAPQGLPTPPGAVTGQSVAELQQQLNAIG